MVEQIGKRVGPPEIIRREGAFESIKKARVRIACRHCGDIGYRGADGDRGADGVDFPTIRLYHSSNRA